MQSQNPLPKHYGANKIREYNMNHELQKEILFRHRSFYDNFFQKIEDICKYSLFEKG